MNGSKGYAFGKAGWRIYVPLPLFEEAAFLVSFAALAVFFHLNYFWSSWGWLDTLRRWIVHVSFAMFCVLFVYACIHFKRPA